MSKLPFRQVHLDFHTSEHVEGIGSRFTREGFREALLAGNINSITLFSKCHHGWAYHPSKANEMHPNLDFDLLGAQIEAASLAWAQLPLPQITRTFAIMASPWERTVTFTE